MSIDGAESLTSDAFRGLEKFDEGDDQAALGDQRAEQPFHKVGLHRLDGCAGFLPQGFDVGPGLRPQASGSATTTVRPKRSGASAKRSRRTPFNPARTPLLSVAPRNNSTALCWWWAGLLMDLRDRNDLDAVHPSFTHSDRVIGNSDAGHEMRNALPVSLTAVDFLANMLPVTPVRSIVAPASRC